MKQHHIPKDPNFQAPKYQNITKRAQNIKGNYTIWVDIWYAYVTADSN